MHLPSKTKFEYIPVFILAIFLLFLPFKSAIQTLLISFSKHLMLTPKNFLQKIDSLEKEKLSLKFKINEFSGLIEENEKLKKALVLKRKKSFDLIGAEIIVFSPSNWHRSLVINAGRDSNLKKGMLAIDENGKLLGKITEVKENSSTVILINDPNFSLSVFVGEKGFGLLTGSLSGAKILYIEDDDDVMQADNVWLKTSTSGSTIEIGEVKALRKNKNSLFWEVDVKLFSKNTFFSKLFIVK